MRVDGGARPGMNAALERRDERLETAVKEFEAQLVGLMLKEMSRAYLEEESGTSGLELDLARSALAASLTGRDDGRGLNLTGDLLDRLRALDRPSPDAGVPVPPRPLARRPAVDAALTPPDPAPATPVPPFRELLTPGSLPTITSGYGPRIDPLHGRHAFHRGLDLRAASGEAVRSAAAGIVTAAQDHPQLGRYVEVRHAGGLETRYAHLEDSTVREGDMVRAGTRLGTAGATGRATAPHLHFEVRRDGQPVDPRSVLGSEIPVWVWPVQASKTGRIDESG